MMEEIITRAAPQEVAGVPGFLFVDHVAIAVKQGELDAQVSAYAMLGFRRSIARRFSEPTRCGKRCCRSETART